MTRSRASSRSSVPVRRCGMQAVVATRTVTSLLKSGRGFCPRLPSSRKAMVAINSLRSLLAFLLLAGLVTSIPTAGATPFEDGNKLYEQNKYEEALAKYDQAVTDHQWTPNLFHNIANTEYR